MLEWLIVGFLVGCVLAQLGLYILDALITELRAASMEGTS